MSGDHQLSVTKSTEARDFWVTLLHLAALVEKHPCCCKELAISFLQTAVFSSKYLFITLQVKVTRFGD